MIIVWCFENTENNYKFSDNNMHYHFPLIQPCPHPHTHTHTQLNSMKRLRFSVAESTRFYVSQICLEKVPAIMHQALRRIYIQRVQDRDCCKILLLAESSEMVKSSIWTLRSANPTVLGDHSLGS